MMDGSSSRSDGGGGRRSGRAMPITLVLRWSCLVGVGLVFLLSLWWSRAGFDQILSRGQAALQPTNAQAAELLGKDTDEDQVRPGAEAGGEAGAGAGAAAGTGARGEGVSSGAVVVELDRPRQFEGALALKSEKIVYCPIQKVACTEWIKVFRWIDGHEDWSQPRHTKHGLDVVQKMGADRGNEILNSPDWLKFAVVREPAERLLSCFLQKCNQWNMKGEYPNCPYLELWPDLFGREHFPNGVPRRSNKKTLAVVLEAFEERGKDGMFATYVDSITRRVKADPCGQNGHWSPQFCHCSLDVTAPVFNIVGWHNMTEGAAAAIVPAASSPARGSEIATFLDERMKSNHERDGKKTSARSSADKAYTEDMLRAVHEAYARDYLLFSKYWEQT